VLRTSQGRRGGGDVPEEEMKNPVRTIFVQIDQRTFLSTPMTVRKGGRR